MADPVLHLLVGPNGAGKSTLFDVVVGPTTGLEFVNADVIAAERWPEDSARRSYDAAAVAAELRTERLDQRRSFATETVFSHESKLELVRTAAAAGYLVTMHVVMIPEDLAVARVASRIAVGGHSVPARKVRERYRRLWPLIVQAIPDVETACVYDNSSRTAAFRVVATFERGVLVRPVDWPAWTPKPLRSAGSP